MCHRHASHDTAFAEGRTALLHHRLALQDWGSFASRASAARRRSFPVAARRRYRREASCGECPVFRRKLWVAPLIQLCTTIYSNPRLLVKKKVETNFKFRTAIPVSLLNSKVLLSHHNNLSGVIGKSRTLLPVA